MDVTKYVEPKGENQDARVVELKLLPGRSAEEAAADYIKVLGKRCRGERHDMHSPLTDVDSKFPGWLHPGRLIVVAARPSVGKTSLAQLIAEHCAEHHGAAAIFSLEMNEEEILDRSISRRSGYSMHELRNADQATAAEVIEDVERFGALPLHIDDRSDSIDEIIDVIRRLHMQLRDTEHPLRVVMVDYLQLVLAAGGNRAEQVGAVSRALKRAALDLGIAVLALSQLNRDIEKRTHTKPLLSDLRESGSIEQDADIVIGLWRDMGDDGVQQSGTAEVIVLKNRHGQRGSVEVAWIGERTLFADLAAGVDL